MVIMNKSEFFSEGSITAKPHNNGYLVFKVRAPEHRWQSYSDEVFDFMREQMHNASSELKGVVVDLSELEYLNSRGIGNLVALYKQRMRESTTPDYLVVTNEHVMSALEITRMDRLFRIVPSLVDVLGAVEHHI